MVVNRIRHINIPNRPFFTAIYGNRQDLFIEDDLQRYNFNQQLYRYLRTEQFSRIVFYDLDSCFFSYDSESLTQLINSEVARQQAQAGTPSVSDAYHTQDRRVQGNRRLLGRNNAPQEASPSTTQVAVPTSNPLIQTMEAGRNQYYQWNVQRDSTIFDKIKEFLKQTHNKGCMIFTSSGHTDISAFTGQLISVFGDVERNAPLSDNSNHVFIFYEGNTAADFNAHFRGGGIFKDTFFRSRFFKAEGDNFVLNERHTFAVGVPDEKEIRAILNRRRLIDNLQWDWKHVDKLAKAIFREGYSCEKILQLTQSDINQLQQIDGKTAWEQLEEMTGLEQLKAEIKKQIVLANSPKKLKNLRRHLVFTGNPGTGKTTVARLVAEIYKENNILSRGHLVEGDRETLVEGYLGQTATKTKAACERATGGVLFIDEAYNLKKGEERDEFGEEAINTLLKEMEDKRDNLMVIVAGYTKEMQTFLKANPGLTSRFSDAFIDFPDYTPEQLLEIAQKKAKIRQLDIENILPFLLEIIRKLYEQRDQNFGNARTIETLIDGIVKNHTYRCGLQDLDVFTTTVTKEDIPIDYLTLLGNDKTNNELEQALKELESMIGLQNVKKTVRAYANRIKAQQKRNKKASTNNSIDISLNFIFTGNPGTGKTTIARLLGQILKGLGLLQKDTVLEVNRDGLVAGYVGQTALKTRAQIDAAKGGVFFIDEAYSLANSYENDFGKEAVNTILAAMTDPRYQGKMAFVAAGYPDDMKTFIESNPGLQRRFNNTVHFDNYSSEELVKIFNLKLTKRGFRLGEGVNDKAFRFFEAIPRNRFFGNAGEAEKLADIAITNLDTRIVEQDLEGDDEIVTILDVDIPTVAAVQPTSISQNTEGVVEETPKEEAETLADIVLPNFDSDNKDEVFIRSVCDDVETLFFYVSKAFQGESEPELVIDYFDDKNFQLRVKQANDFRNQYNLALFNEIFEGCGGFINFFKGIQHIQVDDIQEAIRLWDSAVVVADKYDIEVLQKSASILKRYWIAITSLKGNNANINTIISDLESIKKDLKESDINPEIERMIDLIQSEIFFISGVNALQNLDNEDGRHLIDLASASTEINADKYFTHEPAVQNMLRGLAQFYKAMYYFNTCFIKLNNLDFHIEEDISDGKKHIKQAIILFEKSNVSEARVNNVLNLSYALNSLNIVMGGIAEILCSAGQQEPVTVLLEPLKNKLKEARINIYEINEPNDIVIWMRICDILEERIGSLENATAQTEQAETVALPFSNAKNILTEEKVTQQPLDLSKDNVKKLCIEHVGNRKLFDALFILEEYCKNIDDIERLTQTVVLRGNLTKTDENWTLMMQEDSANKVEMNRIATGIMHITTHL